MEYNSVPESYYDVFLLLVYNKEIRDILKTMLTVEIKKKPRVKLGTENLKR